MTCTQITHVKKDYHAERVVRLKLAFIDALEATGNVCKSCEIAGMGRKTAYEWRDLDPRFAAQWEKAVDRGTDMLEDEAVRRAAEGTLEPVFQAGVCVGHVRKFSDTLLIFMLKARRPAKFKDRAHLEVTGKNGQPIDIRMSAEQFKQLPLDERIRVMQSAMGSPASN